MSTIIDGKNLALAIKEKIKEKIKDLEAVFINRYYRKYFLSADKNFRITIDTQMSYYTFNPMKNNFLHRIENNDEVIVELKYISSENDIKVRKISNELPFILTKSSKYVTGIDLLQLI